MDSNNNIFFTVEDKPDNDGTTKLTDIDKMMDELLNDCDGDDDLGLDFEYGFDYNVDCENVEQKTSSTLSYFDEKNLYIGVPEAYYEAHTVKELMRICDYYDLAKNVKNARCKKQDIVATVVFFEAQPENKEIVNKRNNMWAYMKELANDQKMKSYLIWT